MMPSSPAKRRKISATTSIPANATNTNPDKSQPTTPTRASYLSPTKASLARSHPHLAHQRNHRSSTEPRSRALKDDLIKARQTLQGPAVSATPDPGITTNGDKLAAEPARAPPDAQQSAILNTEPIHIRPPTESRQPPVRQPASNTYTEANFIQPPILPKLVKRFEGSTPARGPSPPEKVKSHLPPTPVELGWQEPPERPRGLSSSSPRGSRSGSGRRRRRLGDERSNISSPLKPKDRRPADIYDQESEADMADDQVQDEAEALLPKDVERLPKEVREKQDTLNSLQAELLELKKSSQKLEQVLNSHDHQYTSLQDQSIIDSLRSSLHTRTSLNPRFEQLVTNEKEASIYLELLAPGDLKLSTKTTTKTVKGQPKVCHHLMATVPPPWHPYIFSAAFDVLTDAETATVENIVWVDTMPGKSQSQGITDELFAWLNDCMKSQLHGCNVGGLIWGLGQYFTKTVQRAKILKMLAQRYDGPREMNGTDLVPVQNIAFEEGKPLTADQAEALTRYLTKTELVFELPAPEEEGGIRTRRGKKAEPKIMINWQIELSWNGVAKDVCEIVPSGIPDGAVQSAKELFERLVSTQGIEKAFDAVYELVRGERNATPGPSAVSIGKDIGGSKGRAKKRKHFT